MSDRKIVGYAMTYRRYGDDDYFAPYLFPTEEAATDWLYAEFVDELSEDTGESVEELEHRGAFYCDIAPLYQHEG